jgi:hypothetical protein
MPSLLAVVLLDSFALVLLVSWARKSWCSTMLMSCARKFELVVGGDVTSLTYTAAQQIFYL